MLEHLPGGVQLRWSEAHFRPSTDSLVLADFVHPAQTDRVCDLGCGCGTLSLLLLATHPQLHVTGVEIQPDAAALARENAAQPVLAGRFTVCTGDLRDTALLPAGSFDCVVSNPPYYPVNSGFAARSDALRIARTEAQCTLPALCASAARLLRWGGRFFLVHKPERLTDLLVCLRAQALEPKRLRFVRHSPDRAANLVLIEAVRGAKPALTLQPDLILFTADGLPTPERRRIYHQED